MRTVIVDDELLARNLLKSYLQDVGDVDLIGECENGFEGVKMINELKPDLVILDIQMPKITGIEMLELLDHKPEVIFSTAYDQYAIKAFEHNAIDYLLKPFSKERFLEAIKKVMDTNREEGRDVNEGLSSAEIGCYNRSIMFGEDGEAFPSDDEWSLWVD